MKQHSHPTPLVFNRLGRAALIALPVLVASADAAPKAPSTATRTTIRSARKSDVKVVAKSAVTTRGAVLNSRIGQTVELALRTKARVRVVEGHDVVRTKSQGATLTIEALKAGRALVIVERPGGTTESYQVRVRAADSSSLAEAAPALRVETKIVAQTADLSKSPATSAAPAASAASTTAASTTAAADAAPATTSTAAATVKTTPAASGAPVTATAAQVAPASGTSVTVTPATTTVPADIVVTTTEATAEPAAVETTPAVASTATRSVSTPKAVPSGTLIAGAGTQFDRGRVSPSLPAPSRLPRGSASYPTTSNIPARVRQATRTAPSNSIQVTQGLARLLQFRKNILSVFFSDVNVMDARAVNARTVAITGLVPGTSTLAVFSERFPGDAIGQPVIYQITVRAPAAGAVAPTAPPNIEALETAIRTAIDDPRVDVAVIQSPGGTLTARLTGSVRDAAEAEAIKQTAALFVPNVVSAIYADKEQATIQQVRQPNDSQQLQDSLRRITENSTIEVMEAPGGGQVLKAVVGSVEEANAIMRLIPLQQRVTPFIVVRGAAGGGTTFFNQVRPTLTQEDADMTERLQAVTGVRTVYVSRTAEQGLAVYGTVMTRSEYDTVQRFARILPQKKTGTAEREDIITANFPAGGDRFPLGVQMFVRILDPAQSVLRKVTVHTNVVEINRNALKNLGVEFGSARLLNETITETAAGTTVARTIDPTFVQGSSLLGNTFAGFGGFSNIDPFRARLNALYTRGNARLLSSPNVTALNGADAQITVGGSRPIPTAVASSGGVGTGVEFRKYGIIMTMRPTVTDDDTIILQIRADVTNIDTTTSVNVAGALVPGETTRSINTTLNLREGDIIVMGGLITNERLQRTSRVPFLSSIPILGALFQSRRFENNESELAIFMSPTITRTPASMESDVAGFYAESMRPLPGNEDGGSGATLVNNFNTLTTNR